jgi:hypothetical protein
LSHEYERPTGRPPGFKPVHLVVAGVLAVVWLGVIAFVLTHGRDQASSVDVYSELPPGFTAALQGEGVTYQGLSPVDATTQQQALAHVPATGTTGSSGQTGESQPLVFRTSFSAVRGNGRPGVATPALMVVVPSSGSAVTVDFVDPTTFAELKTVTYGGASG